MAELNEQDLNQLFTWAEDIAGSLDSIASSMYVIAKKLDPEFDGEITKEKNEH